MLTLKISIKKIKYNDNKKNTLLNKLYTKETLDISKMFILLYVGNKCKSDV